MSEVHNKFQEILAGISDEDLRSFISGTLKKDRSFRRNFLRKFDKDFEDEEFNDEGENEDFEEDYH